jgi:hypothetical protein
MALLTSYSNANKQVYELPTTTKTSTPVIMWTRIGTDTSGNAPFAMVEEFTRESYAYVGMDAATAATCAAALIASYTKVIDVPILNPTTGAITYEEKSMLVASVRAVWVVGGMFNVEVERNEPSYSFEPLFTLPA